MFLPSEPIFGPISVFYRPINPTFYGPFSGNTTKVLQNQVFNRLISALLQLVS